MYCEMCGCNLEENTKICPVCGTKVGNYSGAVNIQYVSSENGYMMPPEGSQNQNNMMPPEGSQNQNDMMPPEGSQNQNDMMSSEGYYNQDNMFSLGDEKKLEKTEKNAQQKNKHGHSSENKSLLAIVLVMATLVVVIVLLFIMKGMHGLSFVQKKENNSEATETYENNDKNKVTDGNGQDVADAIDENNETAGESSENDEAINEKNEADETAGETSEVANEINEITNEAAETNEKTAINGAATEYVDESYKDAYKEILKEYKSDILDYDFQFEEVWNGDTFVDAEDDKPITFVDITGDGIPELIMGVASSNYSADLVIYTYRDEKAVKIYEDSVDVQAASGTSYFFFQIEGSDDIYEYTGIGDDGYDYRYNQYSYENGEMVKTHYWYMSDWPNEDYTDSIIECSMDGEDITQEEYEAKVKELHSKIRNILIYNYQGESVMERNGITADRLSETFDQAYEEMSVNSQNDETTADNAELPDDLPDEFYFASGVGAWSTDIIIHQDGTFEGTYHDSDMGVSGDDYDSTVYISNFAGKFTNIKKIDDYTYSMEMEYINLDEEPETVWIEDRIRYIATEPYGLENSTIFYLYLPDSTMANLPEEYVNWIRMPYGWSDSDIPNTLPFYGLYNENMQYGFAS